MTPILGTDNDIGNDTDRHSPLNCVKDSHTKDWTLNPPPRDREERLERLVAELDLQPLNPNPLLPKDGGLGQRRTLKIPRAQLYR